MATYVLATTENKVRWYSYDLSRLSELGSGDYQLLDVLDLDHVPLCGDKATAKRAAIQLGLSTWRYVRIG